MIARNTIIFNDSFKQTPGSAPAGGGLLIAGKPALPGETLSAGTGHVIVDSNLILGNAAEAGDGGGIRLQEINGQDVDRRPGNRNRWHRVKIVNNMISNNVAALAGGGISMADAKRVDMRHNTIANNDSTATAGNAFDPGTPDQSQGQLGAGITARRHSDNLLAVQRFANEDFSDANMDNNIVWHNRTFLFNGAGTTPDPNLGGALWYGLCPATGGDAVNCADLGAWSGIDPYYSDMAVLGVAGSLVCDNCIVSDLGGSDPLFAAEYTNGDRAPRLNQPEQQTIHTPAAFDEGGNYIRLRFGPLTRWDPATGDAFGDYHLSAVSPAVDAGTKSEPNYDFDNDSRPSSNSDIGADEFCSEGTDGCEQFADLPDQMRYDLPVEFVETDYQEPTDD